MVLGGLFYFDINLTSLYSFFFVFFRIFRCGMAKAETDISNNMRIKLNKKYLKGTEKGTFEVLVGEDGFEPSKRYAADLQSVPFGHSGTPPYSIHSAACLEPVDGLEPPTY